MIRVPTLLVASAFLATLPAQGFTVTRLTQPVTWSDGYRTEMDLYRPVDPAPPTGWPSVLCMHGGGGHRRLPDFVAIGNYLAARGYAVYLYDGRERGVTPGLNPGWGQSITEERLLLDSAEAHGTAQALWPGVVDPSRIAVTGSSFGGKHAKWAAAYSGRPLPLAGAVTHYPQVLAVAPELNTLDPTNRSLPGGTLCNDELLESVPTTDPIFVALAAGDYAGARAAVQASFNGQLGPLLQQSTVPYLSMLAWQDFKGQPNSSIDFMMTLQSGVPRRLFLTTGGHATPKTVMERDLMQELRARWFDRFLKNINNGVENEAYAEIAMEPDQPAYNRLGAIWEHRLALQWPPQVPRTAMYLRSGGLLRPNAPGVPELGVPIAHVVAAGYDLLAYKTARASRDPDPRLFGPGHMSRVAVAFDSPPLPQTSEVFGRSRAELHVADTTGIFQLTVELSHVDPAGTAQHIALGTGGHRGGAPGYQVLAFDLGDIAHVVPAGNRLRVTVLNVADHLAPSFRRIRFAPYFQSTTTTLRLQPTAASKIDIPLRPYRASLMPRLATESATAPLGIQHRMLLKGGPERAGQPYLVVLGASGEAPGLLVAGGNRLPVAADVFTSIGISLLGTPFVPGWLSSLDAAGTATPALRLPPGAVSAAVIGFRFTLAGYIADNSLAFDVEFGPATLRIDP